MVVSNKYYRTVDFNEWSFTGSRRHQNVGYTPDLVSSQVYNVC